MLRPIARRAKRWLIAKRNAWPLGRGEIGFVDVGSVGGLPPPWDTRQGDLRFVLSFDPWDKPRRTRHSLTFDAALWESSGPRPFYIYRGKGGTGSSLFAQNFAYVDEHWERLKDRGPRELATTWRERSQLVRTETIHCERLDDVLARELPGQPFHFLKIDAQGAEHQVLRGAEQLLRTHCVGLQLELFTVPLYAGIALQDEVITYLATFGFDLAAKMPAHGSFDSQNECIFLHRSRGPESIRRVIREAYSLA